LVSKAGADSQALVLFQGASSTASDGAPAKLAEYLEAKMHCSNPGCVNWCRDPEVHGVEAGAVLWAGVSDMMAHWLAHKNECKAQEAKAGAHM
jgi:hypothetical protein